MITLLSLVTFDDHCKEELTINSFEYYNKSKIRDEQSRAQFCEDKTSEGTRDEQSRARFCEDKTSEGINITWIESIRKMIDKYSSNNYTKHLLPLFNFDYIWLVDEFIRTSIYTSIPSDQDYLFEGNFMRSISRVINLLTEIEQICDKSNYDLIKKINNCVTILKKDWLNPDSIYLKQNGTIIIID
jgi:superfamily II RNA helicase